MKIPAWTNEAAPRDAAVMEQILKRRGGNLIQLDRVLLWSEPVARHWNGFLGAVRRQLTIHPKFRELAICVVARHTKAQYEWDHHAPEWREGGGTAEQERLLADATVPIETVIASPLFDHTEQLVMRFSLALTREVEVSESLRKEVLTAFGTEQFVELTTAIAAYNMVARVLIAAGVESDA
jgi:alkylhydroperoxidase family enzyme